MKKITLLLVLALATFLLALTLPATAAPPNDNPGKGPPELGEIVFIHYAKDFAPGKPAGKPDKPGKPDKEPEFYSYSGIHWAKSDVPVHYSINLADSRVADQLALEGINSSFDTWTDVNGSVMVFTYDGLTESIPELDTEGPDYNNVVGWADLNDFSIIGITKIWYLLGSLRIVDCDTALNTDLFYAWTQADIGSQDPDEVQLPDYSGYDVDVQNIMTHESGHWLMLEDLYVDTTPYTEQTMYGYASEWELKKRSLESGDEDGIKKIYPARGKKK